MILAGCIVILSPFSAEVGITVGIVWITTFGVAAVVGLVLVIKGDAAFTDCMATVEIFCPREVITTGTCIATRTVLQNKRRRCVFKPEHRALFEMTAGTENLEITDF